MSVWPSLIYIAFAFAGIGLQAAEGKFSLSRFVGEVLIFGLLYWGGFFDPLLRAA